MKLPCVLLSACLVVRGGWGMPRKRPRAPWLKLRDRSCRLLADIVLRIMEEEEEEDEEVAANRLPLLGAVASPRFCAGLPKTF